MMIKKEKNIKNSKKRNLLFAMIGFSITIVIWIFASLILGETRLPSPWRIFMSFSNHAFSSPEIALQGAGTSGFFPHILTTLFRYLVSFILGILLSYICLILIAKYKSFKELFVPAVDILRAIPPLALAPFMLLWFGTTSLGIIAIVIFYTFTMVFVAGVEAIEKLDSAQINFSKTLGANKTTVVYRVVMPSILPAMAGPIRVAASWSWGLVIVGELLGAQNGIGRILNAFIPLLATDLIVVGTVWILILAIGMELFLNVTLGRLLRWMPGLRE